MKRPVSFKVTTWEAALIVRIARRAVDRAATHGVVIDGTSLEMDLAATHANGCPLRLAELLAADDANFAHDIIGIRATIDRETGKLGRNFRPRFAVPAGEAPRRPRRTEVTS